MDASGDITDFGARVYDANFPVFLSPDPLEREMPENSSYIFGNNNPLRYIDKDGLYPGDVVVVFAGADLGIDDPLGSTQPIVNYLKENHTNKLGGRIQNFVSEYNIFTINDLDILTQKAYEFIKKNYNKDDKGKQLVDETGRIIVYGYSWGGVLGSHLTKRLENDNLKVTLLELVDPANGRKSDDIARKIRKNVENANIYYQTNSSFLTGSRGDKYTKNEKNQSTNIRNINLELFMGIPTFDINHSNIDEKSRSYVLKDIQNALENKETRKQNEEKQKK